MYYYCTFWQKLLICSFNTKDLIYFEEATKCLDNVEYIQLKEWLGGKNQ